MIKLPRFRLAHLPTAIEPMQRLSAHLGGPKLFVKRDDQTGLALGGNKTRKLEFLLAEAQSHGAETLITAGAAQSNHCRQTAAAAARAGMRCILVLTGDPVEHEFSGNLLLDDILGAELVWTAGRSRDDALRETFDAAWEEGRRPYLIPYGGSNPTGAYGYVWAMQELMTQVDVGVMGGRPPDRVVFASSSGGTQAGLVAGRRIFGYQGQVLGISVDERAHVLQNRVASLAEETLAAINEAGHFDPVDILVSDAYLGGGYGVMGEREREAIQLFAQTEGLLLDPVYTGRAAAGLVDMIQKGDISREETVLFWHTGGTPAVFAGEYQELLGGRA